MPNKRNFIITYFKLPELINQYFKKLTLLKNFKYVCGQIEVCPKTCRNHIQAYIEFRDKVKLSNLKTVMPGVHLESRKGTRDQARNYCMKQETRLPETEPIEIGEWELTQGSRIDLLNLKDAVLKHNRRIKDIVLNECVNYQQIRFVEKLKKYNSIKRKIDNPPTIYWYYGSTGTGKTKYVYKNFKDIYNTLDSIKWWDGYDQNETILIDDMRKDYCKFHQLLKLLDRYPYKGEIKGGYVEINSPNIIITCPFHPRDLYETREDVEQLLRRITVIQHFKRQKEYLDLIKKEVG